MSLLGRLRSRMSSGQSGSGGESGLAQAERLLRLGGSVTEMRQAAELSNPECDVERSWASLFQGEVAAALELSYDAAKSRPYDVDSRIVHGTVRLARGELDHAAHEFDAVIEEFGAESDAADGRRAVILARGFAPLDDLPASDEEWERAAVLLTTLWRLIDQVEVRLEGLRARPESHPDGMSVIMAALERARLTDRSRRES